MKSLTIKTLLRPPHSNQTHHFHERVKEWLFNQLKLFDIALWNSFLPEFLPRSRTAETWNLSHFPESEQTKVTLVVYFCSQKVPVGTRLKGEPRCRPNSVFGYEPDHITGRLEWRESWVYCLQYLLAPILSQLWAGRLDDGFGGVERLRLRRLRFSDADAAAAFISESRFIKTWLENSVRQKQS